MPKNVEVQDVPTTLPMRGMDTEQPLYGGDPSKSIWMQGFVPSNLGLTTRPGFKLQTSDPITATTSMSWGTYFNSLSIGCVTNVTTSNIDYVNLGTAGWPSLYAPGVAATGTPAEFLIHANCLMSFARPYSASAIYNKSTWAALGYTFGTITDPWFGATYKGNIIIAEYRGVRFEYTTTPGQITGAMAGLGTLAGFISDGYIACMCSFSISDGSATDDVFAFISNTGEALFYAGDNPGASNWGLIGRSNVGEIFTPNRFTRVKGDVLVPTKEGLVSLRNAFRSDNPTISTISAPIQRFWQSLGEIIFPTGLAELPYVVPFYNAKENRVYCFFNCTYSPFEIGSTYANSEALVFAKDKAIGISVVMYDFNRDGWYFWQWGGEYGYDDNVPQSYPVSASLDSLGRIALYSTATPFIGSLFPDGQNNVMYLNTLESQDESPNLSDLGEAHYVDARAFLDVSALRNGRKNVARYLGVELLNIVTGASDTLFTVKGGYDILDQCGAVDSNTIEASVQLRRGAYDLVLPVGTEAKALPWVSITMSEAALTYQRASFLATKIGISQGGGFG